MAHRRKSFQPKTAAALAPITLTSSAGKRLRGTYPLIVTAAAGNGAANQKSQSGRGRFAVVASRNRGHQSGSEWQAHGVYVHLVFSRPSGTTNSFRIIPPSEPGQLNLLGPQHIRIQGIFPGCVSMKSQTRARQVTGTLPSSTPSCSRF